MEKCPVVPEQRCTGARMVYQLQCNLCGAIYLGTSGHTLHKRSLEHLEAVLKGNQGYAMGKHYAAEHPQWTPGVDGHQFPFTSKLVKGPNIQGNIQRYLTEALLIRDKEKTKTILNGKAEWGRTTLKRLAIISE